MAFGRMLLLLFSWAIEIVLADDCWKLGLCNTFLFLLLIQVQKGKKHIDGLLLDLFVFGSAAVFTCIPEHFYI